MLKKIAFSVRDIMKKKVLMYKSSTRCIGPMRQYLGGGGVSHQRVTYDQLSLTQWVQGFCRNVLEERSGSHKDTMISYLADLMEDATYFSWQGAKASHAVLFCEMERGALQWEDGDWIDRIWRDHAQKHISASKSS